MKKLKPEEMVDKIFEESDIFSESLGITCEIPGCGTKSFNVHYTYAVSYPKLIELLKERVISYIKFQDKALEEQE